MTGVESLEGRVIKITVIDPSYEKIRKLSKSQYNIQFQHIGTERFYNDPKLDRTIESFNPHLMIIELLLHDDFESGIVAIRYYHKKFSHTPIIACSRYILDSKPFIKYKEKALKYGAVAALPSIPFPKAEDFIRYLI